MGSLDGPNISASARARCSRSSDDKKCGASRNACCVGWLEIEFGFETGSGGFAVKDDAGIDVGMDVYTEIVRV